MFGCCWIGKELLTVEAQFFAQKFAELGYSATNWLQVVLKFRVGRAWISRWIRRRTRPRVCGTAIPGKVGNFFAALLWVFGAHQIGSRSSTLDFKEGSVPVTRAGSGFSGSFVSGFPTARLGFTLRRGHEGTEHLSTKGTWVPPRATGTYFGLDCLSIP